MGQYYKNRGGDNPNENADVKVSGNIKITID